MLTGIIIGLIGLGATAGLIFWTRERSVKLSWLSWTVFGLWLIYTLGVIAGVGAFTAEGEAKAAGTFAVVFLAPSLVGLVPLRLLLTADARKAASLGKRKTAAGRKATA